MAIVQSQHCLAVHEFHYTVALTPPFGISLSAVNMFWLHGLACCQVVRGLLYKANPQQPDILYLYCLSGPEVTVDI